MTCIFGDMRNNYALLIDSYWDESSCVFNSASDVFTKESSWDISLGWADRMDMDDAALGLGFL